MILRAGADALAAAAALLRAERRVRRSATGALVRTPAAAPVAVSPDARLVARRVRRADIALRRADRLLPWSPTCLVRALALADLLARAGVPHALIRVGVRRDGDALDAHAWVELDGRVVGDDPDVARRFTPVGSVAPARPA